MDTRVAPYLAGLAMVSLLAMPAQADPVEDFYKTHPVTMVLGYAAGGGFDLYARDVARYIGKYIPGHPSVIIENMPGPGASSRRITSTISRRRMDDHLADAGAGDGPSDRHQEHRFRRHKVHLARQRDDRVHGLRAAGQFTGQDDDGCREISVHDG